MPAHHTSSQKENQVSSPLSMIHTTAQSIAYRTIIQTSDNESDTHSAQTIIKALPFIKNKLS